MKLVTGIEAIQSGKPWKHQVYNYWVIDNAKASHITLGDLLKKEFIIKEEPREFWIDLSGTSHWFAYAVETIADRSKQDKWIRVREVEE